MHATSDITLFGSQNRNIIVFAIIFNTLIIHKKGLYRSNMFLTIQKLPLFSAIKHITHMLISRDLNHRYRITEGVTLPFRVLPTIKELGRTRMEINVKV